MKKKSTCFVHFQLKLNDRHNKERYVQIAGLDFFQIKKLIKRFAAKIKKQLKKYNFIYYNISIQIEYQQGQQN